MRGGSHASDAVVGAVDVKAFDRLSAHFTNSMQKGGSLASNAVTNTLTPSAFNKITGGSKQRKASASKQKSKSKAASPKPCCPTCGKAFGKMKGGDSSLQDIMANASKILTGNPTQTESFMQKWAYTAEPANVPQADLTKLLAPGPSPQKGGELRNIHEYMKNTNKNMYRVFNKQGGGSSADAIAVGLNTKDSIMSSHKAVGVAPVRFANSTAMNIIANESVNAPNPITKSVQFGNVLGSDSKFSYGGAKTTTKKKPSPKGKKKGSKGSK